MLRYETMADGHDILTKASQARIAVVGSSNTDMVVKLPHLPSPGETVLGGKFVTVPGGKGANQAVAAARLGASVALVARLGRDSFGDQAVRNFESQGIDTAFIVRDLDTPSGVALIFVDSDGENEIAVAPGANARLSAADVENAMVSVQPGSTIVVQLEIPMATVVRTAELAHERGCSVVLNPAPMPREGLPPGLLQHVDVVVPNQSEMRSLVGLSADAVLDEGAARKLLVKGVKCAVVTLGSQGALVVTPEAVEHQSALEVMPVDTTAAGDAFTGALAVGLSTGSSLADSARFAARVAAFSVTRVGAQSSLPTAAELEAMPHSH